MRLRAAWLLPLALLLAGACGGVKLAPEGRAPTLAERGLLLEGAYELRRVGGQWDAFADWAVWFVETGNARVADLSDRRWDAYYHPGYKRIVWNERTLTAYPAHWLALVWIDELLHWRYNAVGEDLYLKHAPQFERDWKAATGRPWG